MTFTEAEVLEIVRQVIYHNDPEFYEKGGVNGAIPFPRNGTYVKAKKLYEAAIIKIYK